MDGILELVLDCGKYTSGIPMKYARKFVEGGNCGLREVWVGFQPYREAKEQLRRRVDSPEVTKVRRLGRLAPVCSHTAPDLTSFRETQL